MTLCKACSPLLEDHFQGKDIREAIFESVKKEHINQQIQSGHALLTKFLEDLLEVVTLKYAYGD